MWRHDGFVCIRLDPDVASSLTLCSPAYTLESVYADALDQVRGLRDDGHLSSTDYDMITGASKPEDVLTLMNDTILRHASSQSIKQKKERLRAKAKPLLEGIERYGGVIDILASSSPQLHGVNPARLLWGFIKFLLLVSLLINMSMSRKWLIQNRSPVILSTLSMRS